MSRPRAGAPEGVGAKPKLPREILAEAAVWVARLHGPDRSPDMEREVLAWQQRSPAHREAFERCTDVWIDVGKINVSTAFETVLDGKSRWNGGGHHGLFSWGAGAASAAVVAIALIGGFHWWQAGTYDTQVGEQSVVMLDDGSRMLLNTDTELRVRFDSTQRTIEVRKGEAIFEVVKDPKRPFVVRASGSEVVAVGTAFAVRLAPQVANAQNELTVALIEGKVDVRPAGDPPADSITPKGTIAMKAGERLRLDRMAGADRAVVPTLDRPNLEHLTAWKRSEAVFEGTSLRDAVAEMNRYSRTPIVLVDGLGDSTLRVSGLYRTGDNVGFASAVANLLGLKLKAEPGRLELRKTQ